MIKSLTFNQLLTYEGERFAQSFNITIERMLFFRWCQILVPKFWIGFQYWANVWNDSTICLWKTQQEVLDSPVLECRNWRSERPLYSGWRPLAYCACVNRSAQSQSWHIFEATHTGSQTTASETVETLRVPTSPQGEHSLAESRYDHWWRLPDVYVGAKNSTGFPNTCRK